MPSRPRLDGVTFRMYRDASAYAHFAQIITACAKGEGEDRVETPETIATGYDHLVRCDPARDLLVAEVGGEPVGYGRVWWDQEPEGPRVYRQNCFLDPGFGGRGIGGALFAWCGERLREIAAEHDAPEKVHEAWGNDQRGTDHAPPRRRFRACHVRRRDAAAIRRRSPGPSTPGRRRDPAGSRRPPARDLGGRQGGLPGPLGLRRADGGGLRAVPRVPVPRPDAVEGRLGRRGRGGPGSVVHRHGSERRVRLPARLDRVHLDRASLAPPRSREGPHRREHPRARLPRDDRRRLGVHTENPNGAFDLYAGLGYEVVGTWTTYRKPL